MGGLMRGFNPPRRQQQGGQAPNRISTAGISGMGTVNSQEVQQENTTTQQARDLWDRKVPSELIQQRHLEYAYLARDVYHDLPGQLPLGWRAIADEGHGQMNVDPSAFRDGFFARLYQHESGDYALVFRGTELTSLEDWRTNLSQVFGLQTSQYKQAIRTGRAVNNFLGNNTNLTMVGYSLGGGLATASSLATGNNGVTFNAAAVAGATLDRHGASFAGHPGKITAYSIRFEVLNTIQDYATGPIGHVLWGASFSLYDPATRAAGKRVVLPGTTYNGPLSRHSMDTMIQSMETYR